MAKMQRTYYMDAPPLGVGNFKQIVDGGGGGGGGGVID